MFHDSFADFESQVQPGEARVAVFERLDDAERVQIMIEALPKAAHLAVQLVFAGVRKRGMPDVVAEGERLGEVLIQLQSGGYGAGDLRNLDGVRQAVAEMVGDAGRKNLHLVFEAAEGPRVNDAVAIALELVAIRVRKLGVAASAALLHWKAQSAGRGHFFWDKSSSALRAARLMLLRSLPRKGSRILRARAGSLGAIRRANAMVADSLETSSVGWSITDCMRFSPSFCLPWAA